MKLECLMALGGGEGGGKIQLTEERERRDCMKEREDDNVR